MTVTSSLLVPVNASPRGWSLRFASALLLPLLFLLSTVTIALADPDYPGPILPGFDPVLRATKDSRLLGAERLLLRHRLLRQGLDPARSDSLRHPTLAMVMRAHMDKAIRIDLKRLVTVTEINGSAGLETVFQYPEFFFLFQNPQELPDGFTYYPPRPVDSIDVDLFVDDISLARDRRLVVANVQNRLKTLDVGAGGRAGDGEGLINLTIPIKLPRTLEKIIGRGEKTNIRISGRLHISLSGETIRSSDYIGNEFQKQQSWFPALDMEQTLQVNLSGTIGEKINVEVDHNSQAIGPEATKIRLAFEGNEDEIIKSIETGDVGLTLPGSQLLGYSSNKSGLFGIKVTGQYGRAEFTVVTSKQKSESSAKSFNSRGGQVSQHTIEASDYIRNRFFRLDIPPARLPGWSPSDDDVLGWQPDVPGRSWPDEKIDPSSIRVFVMLTTGAAGVGEHIDIAAFKDSSGTWDPAVWNAPGVDWHQGARWGEIENLGQVTTESGDVVAIDLGREYLDTDVLAITYNVVNSATGDFLYRVGDWSEDGSTRVDLDTGELNKEDGFLRLKLLKPRWQSADSYTYQYGLRNFYSLGGTNIDRATFALEIQVKASSSLTPELYNIYGDEDNQIKWTRVFGLDMTDAQGNPGADGIVDVHNNYLIDLNQGLLKFPEYFHRPFYSSLEWYQFNIGETALADQLAENWSDEDDLLFGNRRSLPYMAGANPNEFTNNSTFHFVVTHAAASSSFNLGSSNIEEGSESVILDGRTLQVGVDYEIDYTFGEIKLKGDAAASLNADSQVVVNYQFAPFFGGGKASLLGFNLSYDLGQDSRVSTTWLYESNEITGYKPRLGEEPARNLVGNLNFQHTFRPYFLTHVANFLSLRDSERESSLKINGEFALSIPNSNTMNKVYLEDFEGIDASDILSISRSTWWWASTPDAMWSDTDSFVEEGRVGTIRWYYPPDRVLRRYLNPELENEERDETVSSLQIFMRDDDNGSWEPGEWGGVMRGLGRVGLDLSKAQFLELWVNDFEAEVDNRRGKLHIDFGCLDEDFYWAELDGGQLEKGEFDHEDRNGDYVMQADEDTGLDGVAGRDGDNVSVNGERDDGRDDYSTENPGTLNPYPGINGTEGNMTGSNAREDTEDLDGDSVFNRDNGYYGITIDLQHDEALVDVLQDYQNVPGNERQKHAWRKFRIPLSGAAVSEYGNISPNITTVTHARIWFETDEQLLDPIREFLIAEVKFLGSRWERQGIRKVVGEELIPEIDRGAASFFIGEVNNKENPDYNPPVQPRVEQNITEKEGSLVLDFSALAPGQMVRISKVVSPRGEDYTRFERLSWWWYNPSFDQADVPVYFRVGSDSTSYYEVRMSWDESSGNRVGWHNVMLDIGELSRLKLFDRDPDTGWIEALLNNPESGQVYNVKVVGRPDLRNVKRFFFGVINDVDAFEPISGHFYLNDVLLKGVHKEKGLAERLAMRLDMANVFKVDFDWNKTDAEFHGLDSTVGSGYTNSGWSVSTSLGLHDFIPMMGYRIPMNLSRRESLKLPKYAIQSDILLDDPADRNADATTEERESFTTGLSRMPSHNVFGRYLLDPWSFSLNGTRSHRRMPTSESSGTTLQGGATFSLRLTNRYRFGLIPVLEKIPIIRDIRFLPSNLSGNANFSKSETITSTINPETGATTRQTPNKRYPGTLAGSMEYMLLPVADFSFSLRSERDLLRENDRMGLNIGTETSFSRTMRINFLMPRMHGVPDGRLAKTLRWVYRGVGNLRPSLAFNGAFGDDHPVTLITEEHPNRHSVRNSGDWEFRCRLPVDKFFKAYLPEPVEASVADQMIASQALHDRRAQAIGGSSSGEESSQADDGLTAEERRIRDREQQLAEAQERLEREKEEMGEVEGDGVEGEEGEPGKPGEEEENDAVAWDVATGTGGRINIKLSTFTEPVLRILRNTDPITFSLNTSRSSTYAGIDTGTEFWYRTGLARELGLDDDEFTSSSLTDRMTMNMSTSTQLARRIELSADYKFARGDRDMNGMATRNYSQTWPDARLSFTGLERWRVFGGGGEKDGWFKSSNLDLTFKKARTVNGITDLQYNPKDVRTIGPRWTGNFHNGLTTTLMCNLSRDQTKQSGALTVANRMNLSLQVRHRFQAERLLAKLRLYRPGANPSITMDVDISYNRDTTQRTNLGSALPNEPTGQNRLSVNPRFTYNITRNLTGSLRLIYSRSKTLQTDVVRSTVGLGIETTFRF